MISICRHCGTRNPVQNLLCESCGESMHGAKLVDGDQDTDSAQSSNEPRAPTGRPPRSTIFIVVAACVLALVACGGGILLSRSGLVESVVMVATATPDENVQSTVFAIAVETQVAVEKAAAATLTAEAPTATLTPEPTDTSTPTATPQPTDTPLPTETPTLTPEPTQTASATSTSTASMVPTSTQTNTPTWTPTSEPSQTPQPQPTREPTATPMPTVAKPSLDAYKVYFSNFEGRIDADYDNAINYSVWSMRGDGAEATKKFSEAQQAALSADGTKLAYVTLGAGVRIFDLTTGEDRHVINHASAQSPSFSPDGHRLAYAEYTVRKWWQVYTARSQVHLATTDGTSNTIAVVGRRPVWSPTSSLIAYEACEGANCGLFVLNSDDGSARFLIGKSAGKASWSPNGQVITYSTDEDGDSEIWSVSLDGTSERKLTDNESTDALAAWSPDGQYIYFLSDRQDGWGIWVMDSDGSNQRKITPIGVPLHWQWAKMAVGWNQ